MTQEQTRCFELTSATELFGGKVRYWQVRLDLMQEPDSATLQALSPNERSEMMRFRQREDRVRFAGVRAALWKVLQTEYRINRDPNRDQLAGIQRDQFGKPRLVTSSGQALIVNLTFNVSHSGSYGLIAVSQCGQVGVDIERTSQINVTDLAPLICTSSECDRLAALEEREAGAAFYRLWVGKEAALKAVGVGIGDDHMRMICIGKEGRLSVTEEGAENGIFSFDPAMLTVQSIAVNDGYHAAIAMLVNPSQPPI